MWRRAATMTADHWRGLGRHQDDHIQRLMDDLESPDPQQRLDAYVHMLDCIEKRELCRINIALCEGTGSFGNPAWIIENADKARRSLADLVAGIEVETDPIQHRRLAAHVKGYRKIVRKWEEEEATTRLTLAEWGSWMQRPDRKAFDAMTYADQDAIAYLEAAHSGRHRFVSAVAEIRSQP